MKKTEVTYKDTLEDLSWEFENNVLNNEQSVTDWEDEQVGLAEYAFAEDEVLRLMAFVVMGYLEVKNNVLSDRMKFELGLDIPVWDSGEVDEFLFKEDKELLYPHLQVIKDYIQNNK